ncbi:MAG: hypothetical protein WB760_18815 [Xanthobacteraceae bacterium]
MASLVNAGLCAIVATAFWSLLGYALARHLLPRTLAMGAAPVLGWAVSSAATLPVFYLIGFSPAAVTGVAALCVVASGLSLFGPKRESDSSQSPLVPAWAMAATAAAALLALAPAAAIVPKFSGAGVNVADAIFDHSKIAIIDAMTRQGLPPVNPIFGEAGAASRLTYYYLWHFSAAELALPLRASGWEADIGLTWFTAFASLTLMMGLAVWLSKDARAAILVVMLAAATSLRGLFSWISGSRELMPFLAHSKGFAGWLFQAAWVPQHLMSASCVVMAMLLVARCAQRPSPGVLATLVLTVAAGFESSTYVGGVTLAIAALFAGSFLLAGIESAGRLRFAAAMAVAAVLAACLVAPFVVDQLAATAARADATPVVIRPFEVLGHLFPDVLRRVLDLPAYWLIELPLEFPATFIAGTIALVFALRSALPPLERTALVALAGLTSAGLVGSWLLASTLGDVNDLGLRAVLPAAVILIAVASAGMLRAPRRALIAGCALGGLILSLPATEQLIRYNFTGDTAADGEVFAQTPQLWEAVRRYAGPTNRVANNPLFLQDLTPWPVNLSWALLANRSSCFAGRELALAFAPLPAESREAINEQFIRIFDGEGTPEDVSEMANKYGCDVVVVVPQDKAWNNNPFASSPDYRLAENREGRWRIYVRR